MVEIETRSRIPIWRTFGRIQWYVIPEPPATLQGVRIPPAVLKNVFWHNAVSAFTSGCFGIASRPSNITCYIQPSSKQQTCLPVENCRRLRFNRSSAVTSKRGWRRCERDTKASIYSDMIFTIISDCADRATAASNRLHHTPGEEHRNYIQPDEHQLWLPESVHVSQLCSAVSSLLLQSVAF